MLDKDVRRDISRPECENSMAGKTNDEYHEEDEEGTEG